MSRPKRHHRGGCHVHGAINRAISGCRDMTGMSRGSVIAAFVIGFVFVPLLTTVILLAVLYWTSYPDNARRNADRLSRHARRAARRVSESAFGRTPRRHTATQPDFDAEDFDEHDAGSDGDARADRAPQGRRAEQGARTAQAPRDPASVSEVRERFEELEKRANAIEEFVASEEYRLEREFEKMNKDR